MAVFKAILFDLDGTLVDSMPDHDGAWVRAFESIGITGIESKAYFYEGVKSETFARDMYLERKGSEPSIELINELCDRKENYFLTLAGIHKFFPGTFELLEQVKSRGRKLGLVTGSTGLEARFESTPKFLSEFDVIVTGQDVTRGKPSPEPYLTAARKLGVNPSECLVLENAPLGIKSAKAAGIECWAVKNGGPLPDSLLSEAGAERIFRDLVEVKSSLQ
jgi:beta-phosphoglucomutase